MARSTNEEAPLAIWRWNANGGGWSERGPVMRGPQRYSAVPWLNAADLEPMGDPETTVEVGGGAEITHGLHIARPFGPDTDAMLAIHAVRDSGLITLAITRCVSLDHQPTRRWQPYMDQPQSGASRNRRAQPDDNGANEPDE